MFPILPADIRSPVPGGATVSMLVAGLFLAAFVVIAGIRIVKKNRQNRHLGLFLLLAGFGPRSYADIAPPPPKGTPVEMEVRMDSAAAGGPVLRIPRSALGAGRAEGFGSGTELVVGGAFLSGAIVLGGIWLARRRSRVAPAAGMAAVTLLAVGTSFVAGALWAQNRTLRFTVGDLNGAVEPGQTHSGVVALQIVPGDKASLLLPPPRRRPGPPVYPPR